MVGIREVEVEVSILGAYTSASTYDRKEKEQRVGIREVEVGYVMT